MTARQLVCCAAWWLGAAAMAAETVPPTGVPTEPDRLSVVHYDPYQVLKVWGRFGYTTSIELEDKEKITSVAIGVPGSWEVTPLVNRLVLKPKTGLASTNLTVATDRRTYYFELAHAQGRNQAGARYGIRFKHEPTPEELQAQADASARATNRQEMADRLGQGLQDRATNRKYSYRGNADVAPYEAWDDGRFTYFRFADNQPMPAIYQVDASGDEALANFGVEGNVTIVRSISRQFMLRRGKDVACVYNEGEFHHEFDMRRSGTVSGDVDRVLK
jgi:type IV secretion system protein VirB9